jgi:activator of HSP90 ATPase
MSLETTTIEQTVFLPAKPVQVYDALINARKHSEFTGAAAACDPVVGGRFTAWDGYISGTNLELERARLIVQEWKTSEWPDGYPPSRLEFRFAAKDDGTEVTMVQSDVPALQAENYRQGWFDYYWKPLEEYFAKK